MGTVEPRLRLAAAMLGRLEGEPIREDVEIGGVEWTAAEFEALVEEMYVRSEEAAGAMPGPVGSRTLAPTEVPLPAQYESELWARFDGDLGRDSQQTRPAVDFAGRQLAAMVEDDLLLVTNRFQTAAYEIESGKQRWVNRLDKQQGGAHAWPLASMPPVVAGGRVFVRRLSNRGPELACLGMGDGKLLWSARPGDHVASDPLVAQDQLLAITAAGTQESYLQLNLAAFDPRSGELLFQRPLVQLRDVWNREVPCRAIALDDRIIAVAGGSVICCDILGQVHWLRRQAWVPKALDENWDQQHVQVPLEDDGLLYIAQPGVRVVECLEAATGRLRWQHVLPDLCRLVGIVEGNLIVETAEGLQAYNSRSGSLLWRREADLLTAQACGLPGKLLVVESERAENEETQPALVWLDAATGHEVLRCELNKLADRQPMVGPLVVHGDRMWTFFGRGGREAAREIHALRPSAAL
jgi:outer membrane protein assembly factor BamB